MIKDNCVMITRRRVRWKEVGRGYSADKGALSIILNNFKIIFYKNQCHAWKKNSSLPMLLIIHGEIILEKSENEICQNNFLWWVGIVTRQSLPSLDTIISLYSSFTCFPFSCLKFLIMAFTKPNLFLLQNSSFLFP